MQRIDGRFIYAASDLNNYLECSYLTDLDRLVALGEKDAPVRDDAGVELIARKGDEHEKRYFEQLRQRYRSGVTAFDERPERSIEGFRNAEAATVAAMERGDALIFQGTFFDGRFLGHPDFLRRIESPGERWPWSYEVIDTKLALSPKPYFLLQLCHYSEHLARIQGTAPEYGYIVLGSGDERRFRLDDYAAYYRHVKERFLASNHGEGGYPYECSHCAVCKWAGECEAQRDRDDHLSLVAGIRRDQMKKLEAGSITTLAQLAVATEDRRPRKMSERTFENLRMQAAQQHRQREAVRNGEGQKHFYGFRPVAERSGLAKLPKPAPGDVFFDIEGDPLYRADRGLEYLWGVYLPDEDRYIAFWARDASQEQAAFEQFVDFVIERMRAYPDLHVYHYAPYETSALKRLMGRFASRENEVNAFLRSGTFVDLYPIVRQSLWISQPSYSIKKLEAYYGLKRTAETKRGDDSIVQFETWLATRDDAILEDIRIYNEEDCRSTHLLREWLCRVRDELNATLPEAIPWHTGAQAEEQQEPDERSETERALLDGLPQPDSLEEFRAAGERVRGRWLLGNLLRYHRREARPGWWEYFQRLDNVEDLEERDDKALGGLRLTDEPPYKLRPRDQNQVYTFEFPPQEYQLSSKPVCPDAKKSAGEVVHLDETARRLKLKLSRGIDPERLRALIPGRPIPDHKKRDALSTLGALYLAGTLEAQFPATMDMLLARPPRLEGRIQPSTVTKESVSSVIRSMEGGCLPIQGPPGTGKSTFGAWAIVDLIEAGKRVGVVANSHKAVHNLLRKVEETAFERGVHFRGAHKESAQTEGSAYEAFAACPMIESVTDVSALADEGCRLAAGTTFAWAEDGLAGAFDYLFVDEAGQVCIADALIASRAARNVVLLGDPLQLPQVSQGSHPIAADLSVLEHILGNTVTVPEDRGIFLDTSFRMHPAICRFISQTFYEGRLRATESTATNAIHAPGLSASGLVYVPVAHHGNRNRSEEEAGSIVSTVSDLLRGSVIVNGKPPRALTPADVLVVAPYNLQRIRITQLLKEAGHAGVRVGTVDKFQGQQAPVVLYSMAASTAEDVPRGVEFLFDRHRFNVAISRAQCLSVLFCSPRLLEAPCKTPAQMALVNALVSFVERSRTESLADPVTEAV